MMIPEKYELFTPASIPRRNRLPLTGCCPGIWADLRADRVDPADHP